MSSAASREASFFYRGDSPFTSNPPRTSLNFRRPGDPQGESYDVANLLGVLTFFQHPSKIAILEVTFDNREGPSPLDFLRRNGPAFLSV